MKKIRILKRSPYYAGIEGSESETLEKIADRLIKEGYAEEVQEEKAVKKTPKKIK